MRYIPLFVIAGVLAFSWALGYIPLLLPAWFFLLSLVAFVAYARDKRAALKGNRRIPESTLHLFALLGGWPGAILAQQLFRHKTIKKEFRLVFWLTVLVNSGLLVWLHTPDAAPAFREFINGTERLVVTWTDNVGLQNALRVLLEYKTD